MIAMKAYFFLQRLVGNERGLTLPEYGIGLALAIGLGTVALSGLADSVAGSMDAAGDLMPQGAAAAP